LGIPRPHGSTSQQPQLQGSGGSNHEDRGGTQQRGQQEIESKGDTPMDSEECGVGGVQVLQYEDKTHQQSDDCNRYERP
jgi:hypothetical protein